jgi:Ran-binding protein 1
MPTNPLSFNLSFVTSPRTLQEESTATFQPVIHLEEVEVKSGEEEEEVVFSIKAKCYLFGETLLDKGSGNKTWMERGTGEVKMLKHKEFGKIRLLMRQEKTMKIIINHVIDPRIVLEPNNGSDKAWVWSAFDFSDGELVEQVFALKFGNSEKAGQFKTEFEASQKHMEKELAGEDAADAGAADEVADALAGLSAGGDKAEEGAEAAS